MKKKVVFNACHGGFALSKIAVVWLAGRGHEESIRWLASCEAGGWGDSFFPQTLARHSSLLVECIEVVGRQAWGSFSVLEIAEVDDLYRIEEYDGLESVVEPGDVRWVSALRDAEILPQDD